MYVTCINMLWTLGHDGTVYYFLLVLIAVASAAETYGGQSG